MYDTRLVTRMEALFEADLRDTTPYTYAMWLARPLREKLAERLYVPFKSQL